MSDARSNETNDLEKEWDAFQSLIGSSASVTDKLDQPSEK